MIPDQEVANKAEFNMAVSYLNRINVLLSSCDEASIKLDVYSWFHSLLATFRELSTWMSPENKSTFNASINRINPMISQIYQKGMMRGKLEVSSELYMELHEFEMQLREIANKAGLLMKMADDAYNALK